MPCYVANNYFVTHKDTIVCVLGLDLTFSFCAFSADYSSSWHAPRWCVHSPTAQWREKLWSEAQQAIRPQNSPARYTKVLRHTCRPTVSGM